MAHTIIEVSGADFSGKSTQAELLTYFGWDKPVYNFGSFGKYSSDFPAAATPQEDWRWWFQDTTPDQLGEALASAYNRRQATIEASAYPVGVVERGAVMTRAQLAANFATRRDIPVADCADEMDRIIDKHIAHPAAETKRFEIVLENDAVWLDRIADCVRYVRSARQLNPNYTPAQNEFYAKYLMNLGGALVHFSADSDASVVPVNNAAVDVQNNIRRQDSIAELDLPALLEQDPLIVGIGGLSECGKGTLAQSLADNHGFTRLKLGFFNEMTRGADGGQRYGDPHVVAMNALRFVANNRHLTRVSFESLYGPHLAAEFKALLGDRWKAVMIDVPDEVRIERALQEHPAADVERILALQRKKDELKLAKGMAEFRQIADIRVDNDGPSADTMIAKVVKGLGI